MPDESNWRKEVFEDTVLCDGEVMAAGGIWSPCIHSQEAKSDECWRPAIFSLFILGPKPRMEDAAHI